MIEKTKQMLTDINNSFIAQRTKKEIEFDKWAESVLALKATRPDLFEGVYIPACFTFRDMLAVLYAQESNPEVCAEQIRKVREFMTGINAIITKYREESASLLQEYHVTSFSELKNKFLQERAKQEMQVATWANDINQVDLTLLEGIKMPASLSLKGFVPELYEENPRPQVCAEQYAAMQATMRELEARQYAILEEAEKCLQEYREMTLAQV